MNRELAAACLALVLAVGTAACGATPATHAPEVDYVALGDSYTSAPGVGRSSGDDGCFRSRDNYPHLVARKLGLDLEDHSCAGAGTASVTQRQLTLLNTWVAPQAEGVTAETDVVTVGLGANDFALYNLISTICPKKAVDDPHGRPCTDADRAAAPGQDLASKLRTVQDRLVAALRAIERRAPHAKVLVVGYPDVVPKSGVCPELPLAPGDVPFAGRVIHGLNHALSRAAARAKATYVDLFAVTRGHDICSDDPWIAGKVDRSRGVAWHPYAAEQQAAAKAVIAALDRS